MAIVITMVLIVSVSVRNTFLGNYVNSRTVFRTNPAQMKEFAGIVLQVVKKLIVIVRKAGMEKNARIAPCFVSIVCSLQLSITDCS